MSFKDVFQDLISKVSNSGGSSPSVVGLDIGLSSIKAVQMKKEKGRAVLETYGEIALGPYVSQEVGKAVTLTPDIIAQAIKDLFAEANITSGNVAMSVPFASTLVKLISVPKIAPKQMKSVIPIEARKHIPVPLSEVMLDWFVVPGSSSVKSAVADKNNPQNNLEFVDVLLVAVHKDAVSNLQQIANASKFNVKFFELELFATVRSSAEYDIAPKIFVDIGASSSKVYVVQEGIIKVSHMVNFGSQSITDNIARSLSWNFEKAERVKKEVGILKTFGESAQSEEEKEMYKQIRKASLIVIDRIINDIHSTMLSYEKKFNKSMVDLVLLGGGASMPGLVEYMSEKVSVNISKATPFEKLYTPAFLDEVTKSIGVEFTVAIGLGLRDLQG